MLKANVNPKIVQERLGHSTIAITLDLYSRALANMQTEAAKSVDAVQREAINRRGKSL
jgi:integrase